MLVVPLRFNRCCVWPMKNLGSWVEDYIDVGCFIGELSMWRYQILLTGLACKWLSSLPQRFATVAQLCCIFLVLSLQFDCNDSGCYCCLQILRALETMFSTLLIFFASIGRAAFWSSWNKFSQLVPDKKRLGEHNIMLICQWVHHANFKDDVGAFQDATITPHASPLTKQYLFQTPHASGFYTSRDCQTARARRVAYDCLHHVQSGLLKHCSDAYDT